MSGLARGGAPAARTIVEWADGTWVGCGSSSAAHPTGLDSQQNSYEGRMVRFLSMNPLDLWRSWPGVTSLPQVASIAPGWRELRADAPTTSDDIGGWVSSGVPYRLKDLLRQRMLPDGGSCAITPPPKSEIWDEEAKMKTKASRIKFLSAVWLAMSPMTIRTTNAARPRISCGSWCGLLPLGTMEWGQIAARIQLCRSRIPSIQCGRPIAWARASSKWTCNSPRTGGWLSSTMTFSVTLLASTL